MYQTVQREREKKCVFGWKSLMRGLSREWEQKGEKEKEIEANLL